MVISTIGMKKHSSKISSTGMLSWVGLQPSTDGIYSNDILMYRIVAVTIATIHNVITVAMIALVVTIRL